MDHSRSATRRGLLASTAAVTFSGVTGAAARVYPGGAMPWDSGAADPPAEVRPGPWLFFTADEGRLVEAIVERLIPADDLSVSGKDAGCAVFIDRQLAGSFGKSTWLYRLPPFQAGLPTQGEQADTTPAIEYRRFLAAIDAYCRANFGGKVFAELPNDQRDQFLTGMEKGEIQLGGGINSGDAFKQILDNTMEGFFADPIYGGNRDMVSWRMIGYPGTRYNYLDHVSKHNVKYPLPPVSLLGRPEWDLRG
ncbi:gluconate 2-dehydrogenase subunit 3 family protein [Roseomonas elaeocarpi]|uniref:Gluconate 2-dehydrogenase subunit 3 family protein n=1 Tax=Roseomonas elaeocarpi TaxID=907779 RepID=A0ABV6JQY4_9PROT